MQKLGVMTKSLYGIGDMATASVVGVVGYLLNPFMLNRRWRHPNWVANLETRPDDGRPCKLGMG